MSSPVALAAFGLNVLVVGVVAFRLRRPVSRRVGPVLAGALPAVLGVGAYLLATRPPVNLVTALVLTGAAVALGAALSLWSPDRSPQPDLSVRRPFVPLAAWAIAYALGLGVAHVVASPEGQAAGALLMLVGAGIAIGSSIALLRSVRTVT